MFRLLGASAIAAALVAIGAQASQAQGMYGKDTSAAQASPSAMSPAATQTATPSDTGARALAVKHTQAAIDAGKSGDAKGVADHAQEALNQVNQLKKQQPSPNIEDAVNKLRDAITKGKSGDASGAMASAQDALTKLQTS